jgi:hypothetical protein
MPLCCVCSRGDLSSVPIPCYSKHPGKRICVGCIYGRREGTCPLCPARPRLRYMEGRAPDPPGVGLALANAWLFSAALYLHGQGREPEAAVAVALWGWTFAYS